MKTFYTYLWLREDGTPYYVGKGTLRRALRKGHPKGKVIVQEFPTEQDAFAAEKFLISYYGRKDLSEGCLINLTNGGEGQSGRSPWNKGKSIGKGIKKSLETCRRISLGLQGKERTREHAQNNGSAQLIGQSGHRGILWDGQRQKWKIRLTINGRRKHFGFYDKLPLALGALNAVQQTI